MPSSSCWRRWQWSMYMYVSSAKSVNSMAILMEPPPTTS